ncbi:MarR family winged helix-turn-helix transcriptional regulator [Timonella senegalensis]|uniref:MarR family winged helix-turn-helix transcriptional regulator n=1 Tax=Timonella senegalensis TaxID=1465825 RepID=UPI0028ACA4B9|nr:MarR family transcriptional regulator [Timonella senegalensis]
MTQEILMNDDRVPSPANATVGPRAGVDAAVGPRAGVDAETVADQARLIARYVARIERLNKAAARNGEMDASHVRILWMLATHGPMTLAELSRRLVLEQSTVNRQVNSALKNGLLGRDKDGDRKAYVFHATGEGIDAFERSISVTTAQLEGALQGMGEDASTLVLLMERLVADLPDTF